jgi:hypothetical protein
MKCFTFFFGLCFTLLSGFSYGAEIKVFEKEVSPWEQVVEGSFSVNPSLGRAWVVVETSERTHGGRQFSTSSYRNVHLSGLFFDTFTSKIMLEHGGELVECGYQTGRGIFKYVKEKSCHFEARKEWRDFDNGFKTYRSQLLQLFLITQKRS